MTVEEVFAEVRKDAPYYERTGGGLTLSGGECLLYPDFAYELFTECHNAGINTAVESAFNVPRENIERILPVTDTLIVDIKHIDGEQHRFWTGTGNETILANLRRVADRHPRIWIRIPVIPGATDSGDNIRRIAELANILPGVCRLELLKYNPLAENKYAALGGEYRYETFGEAQSDEWMEDLRSGIKIRPDIMVSVV
jgi:pyruvate formate lyase activating enzyme